MMRHVFIIGAKGFRYGGYETFLDRLTECHRENKEIQYHIACKANGIGSTDESILGDVEHLSENDYMYHNAHCFKVKLPNIGSAQAVFYDIKALNCCLDYIKKNHIERPIVYVLSSRIGFAIKYFAKEIHKLGGLYYHNPDGLEFRRNKYPFLVRGYWKYSEKQMVKYADLEICDSKNIEKYINRSYTALNPKTIYIAYGADVENSGMSDDDEKYTKWLKLHNLRDRDFYISVGRFVPENNFETMIREFMASDTTKDFAIITTNDHQFLNTLDSKLHFRKDKRIKFVGTVYDQKLLKKIRERAYGYIHGHSVGGTNPSLLEALGSTKINLLFDVGFNREVAEDSALYWTLRRGSLAKVIDRADNMNAEEIKHYGKKAKERITNAYSWSFIGEEYKKLWMNKLR